MMKIIFASHNPGKIHELNQLLSSYDIELIPQQNLKVSEIAETGLSFVENALIKARHASELTNLPAMADDSGLVIPALNGAPGIYSARYAGEKANAKDNIQKLLTAMKAIPKEKRQAFFYCVIVLMTHAQDPAPIICEGRWEGIIATTPKGEQGFGYDPIFYLPSLQKTAAELSIAEKNTISHRGIAVQLLVQQVTKR